jgi:hypothetical protein
VCLLPYRSCHRKRSGKETSPGRVSGTVCTPCLAAPADCWCACPTGGAAADRQATLDNAAAQAQVRRSAAEQYLSVLALTSNHGTHQCCIWRLQATHPLSHGPHSCCSACCIARARTTPCLTLLLCCAGMLGPYGGGDRHHGRHPRLWLPAPAWQRWRQVLNTLIRLAWHSQRWQRGGDSAYRMRALIWPPACCRRCLPVLHSRYAVASLPAACSPLRLPALLVVSMLMPPLLTWRVSGVAAARARGRLHPLQTTSSPAGPPCGSPTPATSDRCAQRRSCLLPMLIASVCTILW